MPVETLHRTTAATERADASAVADGAGAAVAAGAPRLFFVLASAAIVVAALHFGKPVLMPLALATLLAFVLDPLVTRLRRVGVPMAAAVALVVTTTLGLLGALSVLGAQQLAVLSRDLPSYQITIQQKLRELRPAPGGNSLVGGAARLMSAIEGEIDAARSAIEPRSAQRPAPTRVQVEPAPAAPLRALGDMAAPLLVPLATAGLVVVLLAYMLAQRREVSDRLIRLVGGDLHRMADALNDAARRVSRYLVAQVLVNVGHGAVFAFGLWWIGVPGGPLWGALAAALRFVPYLGPLLAAVMPLLLAFAVDPGWSLVLWTLALVVALELAINNVVEPMAYGRSTGVSAVAVLVSAAFWALVWGPMGLVLATPLTVCLVVLGRHLGALRFFDVLLGTGPAFDKPMQLYRRLISGDREEALAMAADEAERTSLRDFYSATGVPMLALAAAWAARHASPQQRHRVCSGAAGIVAALREDHGGAELSPARVLCVGARSEFDTLSAEMLAHTLAHQGVAAQSLPAAAIAADGIAALPLDGVQTLVLSTFHAQPQTHARFVCKRLRRRSSQLRIVLAVWAGETAHDLRDAAVLAEIGADALAVTLAEAASRALPDDACVATAPVPAPTQGEVGPSARERLLRAAQRAAEVFHVPLCTLLWRDGRGAACLVRAGRHVRTQSDAPAAQALMEPGTPWAGVVARGTALAVRDLACEPAWAAPAPPFDALVAFAGVPLRDGVGHVVGVLALHDERARSFSDDELHLLARMAGALSNDLAAVGAEAQAASASSAESYPPSGVLPAAAGATTA